MMTSEQIELLRQHMADALQGLPLPSIRDPEHAVLLAALGAPFQEDMDETARYMAILSVGAMALRLLTERCVAGMHAERALRMGFSPQTGGASH